ncbi:single-stranded-DNA-specific exonuclease RecJ [Marivirga atlantica]|uniref:Single-stranded-DNA-specific exonuclease RecJ n=1 Tax=Marivirga atlantica TaxID=1548457 RepID=A0A937AKN0_9BACT|nr:single-stranded-DNA-specific exonuclease RecJ [Marivirga atlantica]MBL0764457.1 single-stranded-DNA-specific exonuclease RecJ [Marivirga atlantica]
MQVEKKWVLAEEVDENQVTDLSKSINVNPTLAKILVQRGIISFDEAKAFFRPQLEELHDPFKMKDMDKAVERILTAFDQNESIMVYGDYDVDGTTAVASMYSFLNSQYTHLTYYIPDRYLEGYGLSKQGIDYAKENNISLIITLDCGIKAVELIRYAKELGIDVIICDHHLPGKELPPALAVLDPKQTDCKYPFKELSGCGVGFKLIQALCTKLNLAEYVAYEYLDLVAVSIAADIVSVTGENRTLAFYGLEKINFNPKPGIKALLHLGGVKSKVEISHLVFQVSPRINAAGRIDHAHLAVKLLIAKNEEEAMLIAQQVGDKNNRRKDFDQGITKEAIQIIESTEKNLKAKTTVLYQKNWHKGVIGIVASRCIEKYYRPTIILTESNGQATGSARSVHGFDIHQAISNCADLLSQYGGHKYAAGLTMPIENINAFVEKFEQEVSRTINDEDLIPKVKVDSYIALDQITDKFFGILSQMDPYGPNNMQPVFAAKDLELVSEVKILKEQHLKFNVKDKHGKVEFTALAFGMRDALPILNNQNDFEIAFTIQMNEFNGTKSLQLVVKDIRRI